MKLMLMTLALLVLLTGSAHAGDWTVTWHMPTTDWGGTCGTTGTAHAAGHTGRAILRWTGPSAGADSVSGLADGALVTFARTSQLEGLYTFTAWNWDLGGYSCPVQVTKTVVDTTPPSQPGDVTIVP